MHRQTQPLLELTPREFNWKHNQLSWFKIKIHVEGTGVTLRPCLYSLIAFRPLFHPYIWKKSVMYVFASVIYRVGVLEAESHYGCKPISRLTDTHFFIIWNYFTNIPGVSPKNLKRTGDVTIFILSIIKWGTKHNHRYTASL